LAVTDRKREESTWAESSAAEDSHLPPVRPQLEALFRTD